MKTRKVNRLLKILLAAETLLLIGAVCAGLYFWKQEQLTLQAMAEAATATTIPPTTEPTTVPTTAATTEATTEPEPTLSPAQLAIETFAYENDLSVEDYPESIVALLERNPEAEEFVLNYPLEYGKEQEEVDLSEYADSETVPLFMQWDPRWGYMDYGDDVAGLTACGPVTLSMAAYYYTRSNEVSPDKVIQMALDNGYCAPGNGSYWSLIEYGAGSLGLDTAGLYIDKEVFFNNLEAGWLIICVVGEGDFTTSGHFLLITGVEDGLLRINDCNSRANSEKLWDFDDISDQIVIAWVVRYYG